MSVFVWIGLEVFVGLGSVVDFDGRGEEARVVYVLGGGRVELDGWRGGGTRDKGKGLVLFFC